MAPTRITPLHGNYTITVPTRWQSIAFLLGMALMVACQPRLVAPTSTLTGEESQLPNATSRSTPGSPAALYAEPTLVLQAPPENSRQPNATPLTTLSPDPLRFTFPTPGLAPLSAWRPPLYPTPWAPTLYDHFYFTRPIAADEVNWPVANYRYGGEFFENVVHTGVDIPASKGTPVLAAGPGRVVWAGYGVYRGGDDPTDPYGLAVTIRHDFGYQNKPLYTIYGHLDQVDVAEGQYVNTGDQLGLVGETGNVTGPHLHFEVRLGENSYFTTRNPELWTVPPIGWGVLVGRIMDSNGMLVAAQQIIVTNPDSGQNWFARSYGFESVNSDSYYGENLVVGDLPAGTYELRTAYAGSSHSAEIEIRPGRVTYFVFRGYDSFSVEEPPQPTFDPQPYATPTP
jgi:murein DD-endopeptidase MepM/ murein hydrolase activator NlpD